MISPNNAEEIVQLVFDYYSQRYVQNVRLFSPEIHVGSSVESDTFQSKQIGGIVEKMDMNLSGGFLVDTEIIGVVLS